MFQFNIFLFEPVCHFLKLSRVIEASMKWGYVHCALHRSDNCYCDQWTIRNCAFQEQFLTIIDKVHDCKQTRQDKNYALICKFFFSVKLGGCRWQRLFMEETKSGKNTLCATADSWDSIAVLPLPPETKTSPWKIPHVPLKNKMSTQQQLIGLNLDGNLKLGQEVTPDPNLHRRREI